MKRLKFLILLLLFAIVVEAEDYNTYNYTYIGAGFSIECPNNISIEQRAEAGFFIYNFKYNNRQILGAYSGLQPNFEKPNDSNCVMEEGWINSCPCRSFKLEDPAGDISGEVLISIMNNEKLQTYVHYWYEHLSASLAEMVERIINSTRPYISMEKAVF